MNPFHEIREALDSIEVTDAAGKILDFETSVNRLAGLLKGLVSGGNKVYLIGNGASAAIASHMYADLLKNGQIPAFAFNDPALLTCLSNDLGYESVFAVPLKTHAQKGDILFAISSSGESRNIIEAASIAQGKGCFIVTFSGFDRDNPLRRKGSLNFYVPSQRYGAVEVIHHAICHNIADALNA